MYTLPSFQLHRPFSTPALSQRRCGNMVQKEAGSTVQYYTVLKLYSCCIHILSLIIYIIQHHASWYCGYGASTACPGIGLPC